MHAPGLKHLAVAILLAGCTSFALAQYIWLNEKGVKQYSDLPPPASVPDSKILKSPDRSPPANVVEKSAEPAETNEETAKKAPLTIAEKNIDFQKRRMEQAEKDKERAALEKTAADKKKNCERASDYQRTLDSGMRISRMDQAGERVYLSDEERAQEIRENKRALLDCK